MPALLERDGQVMFELCCHYFFAFLLCRFIRSFVGPETMPGTADEHIFQAWLVNRYALNFARESLDHVGHKAMSVLDFEAHLVIEHRGM